MTTAIALVITTNSDPPRLFIRFGSGIRRHWRRLFQGGPKAKAVTFIRITVICLFGTSAAVSNTDEFAWPRWRGPNGNGISAETDWNPHALVGGPKILWKADIGIGYSNVVVLDDRAYTMGTKEGNAALLCLDAERGKEIWRCGFKDPFPPQPTPIVEGNYVYALSTKGDFVCVHSKNGKIRWAKSIRTDYTTEMIRYGYAQSPVIDGDLIILNTNVSGMALNKANGETVWSSEPYSPESTEDGFYSTAVLYVYKGIRCSLIFSGTGLLSVESETGRKIWFYPWVTSTAIAADPIVFGNKVFLSSGKNADGKCALLEITEKGPAVVWQNTEMRNYYSTCVLVGGHLYGIDGDSEVTLRCMDFKTGAVMWKNETKMATLISADKKLIVLEEDGTLRIAEANSASYMEIARANLIPGGKRSVRFWTPPVLYKGRIYCRDFLGALYCVDVAK